MAAVRAAGATSTTGTTSVAAIASVARSAPNAAAPRRRRGGPDGEARLGEHARDRGHEALLGRLAAQAFPEHAHRLQHEVVERSPREGHAAGQGGGPGGVEPELALLDAHRGREARVHLGQADVAQRAPEVARPRRGRAPPWPARPPGGAGPSGSPPGRSAAPRGGRASDPPRRRPRTRPFGRADQESRRLVDGPLAGVPPVVGEGQRSVVRARRGDGRPRRGVGGRRPRGCARATALKRAHSAAISSRSAVRRQVLGGGQRVLHERVLLHRREHDPRRRPPPGPRSRAGGSGPRRVAPAPRPRRRPRRGPRPAPPRRRRRRRRSGRPPRRRGRG